MYRTATDAYSPFIGGFAAQYKGWRWTQWCMEFISLAVYIAIIPMKETYKPIILKRRAKKSGIQHPETDVRGATAVKRTLVQNLLRPIHMLFIEVRVSSLLYWGCLNYADHLLAGRILCLLIHSVRIRRPLPVLRRISLGISAPTL